MSAMVVDSGETTLVTGDSSGCMFVWSVAQYCLSGREEGPPQRE